MTGHMGSVRVPDQVVCMHAQVWDLRKVEVSMSLKGHSDTVTGLRVSPDGTHLLSNAMVRSSS